MLPPIRCSFRYRPSGYTSHPALWPRTAGIIDCTLSQYHNMIGRCQRGAEMSERRRNFHDQVVDELGRQIASGLFAPGEPVPTEPALAEQMGVSRVVVREASKSPEEKGM